MPFQKGNTLQKKGHETKRKQKESWWAFVSSGGLRTYQELYETLGRGEPINKWQELFMEKTEKSFPFIKERKTDITSAGEKIQVAPILGGLTEKED